MKLLLTQKEDLLDETLIVSIYGNILGFEVLQQKFLAAIVVLG